MRAPFRALPAVAHLIGGKNRAESPGLIGSRPVPDGIRRQTQNLSGFLVTQAVRKQFRRVTAFHVRRKVRPDSHRTGRLRNCLRCHCLFLQNAKGKRPRFRRETGFEICLTWSFDARTLSLGVRINRLKQNRGFPLRKPLRTAYRTSWKRELRISLGWLSLFPLSPSVLFRPLLFPAEDGRKSCRSNLAVRTCSGRSH